MRVADETIFQGTSYQPSNPPSVATPPSVPLQAPPGSPDSPSPARKSLFSVRTVRFLVGLGALIVILLALVFIASKLFGNKNNLVTLTYWGLWEDQNVFSSVIADFERQNPNIKIDYSKQDIRDYRERLMTRTENSEGPDIFRFHNTWYPMLSGILLPMPEAVITKEDFNNNYYPVAREDLVRNGAIYGIPLHIDTLALYVNKEMFEASGISYPKTWEEFRDTAYQLTVVDEEGSIKTSGAALGTFDNISHSSDIISLLLIQNGVDVYNLTPDQRLNDTLSFYTSFASEDPPIWNDALDNSLLSFSKGNLAMFFGYSWDHFTIRALNPTLPFEIIPVPQLESENPKNLASYWAEGISSESKHKKEAFIFMKYLSLKETQEKLFAESSKIRPFGEPYSHVSLGSRLNSNKDINVFVNQAPNAYSSYFIRETYDNGLNEKLNNYLKDAINFILENGSEESASETLIQGYNQVLTQYENPKK